MNNLYKVIIGIFALILICICSNSYGQTWNQTFAGQTQQVNTWRGGESFDSFFRVPFVYAKASNLDTCGRIWFDKFNTHFLYVNDCSGLQHIFTMADTALLRSILGGGGSGGGINLSQLNDSLVKYLSKQDSNQYVTSVNGQKGAITIPLTAYLAGYGILFNPSTTFNADTSVLLKWPDTLGATPKIASGNFVLAHSIAKYPIPMYTFKDSSEGQGFNNYWIGFTSPNLNYNGTGASVYIGDSVGQSTGFGNIGIGGYNFHQKDTTSGLFAYSVALGFESQEFAHYGYNPPAAANEGGYNTSEGAYSLNSCQTCHQIVSIGAANLWHDQYSDGITSIGYSSLMNYNDMILYSPGITTVGYDNAANLVYAEHINLFGAFAGRYLKYATNTIMIGDNAGGDQDTCNNCVIIGDYANLTNENIDQNITRNSAIAIGAYSYVDRDSMAVIGGVAGMLKGVAIGNGLKHANAMLQAEANPGTDTVGLFSDRYGNPLFYARQNGQSYTNILTVGSLISTGKINGSTQTITGADTVSTLKVNSTADITFDLTVGTTTPTTISAVGQSIFPFGVNTTGTSSISGAVSTSISDSTIEQNSAGNIVHGAPSLKNTDTTSLIATHSYVLSHSGSTIGNGWGWSLISGLGVTDSSKILTRLDSNQIGGYVTPTQLATNIGDSTNQIRLNFFKNGGNSFGSAATIGTNDANSFSIIQAGVVRALFNSGIMAITGSGTFTGNVSATAGFMAGSVQVNASSGMFIVSPADGAATPTTTGIRISRNVANAVNPTLGIVDSLGSQILSLTGRSSKPYFKVDSFGAVTALGTIGDSVITASGNISFTLLAPKQLQTITFTTTATGTYSIGTTSGGTDISTGVVCTAGVPKDYMIFVRPSTTIGTNTSIFLTVTVGTPGSTIFHISSN